MTIKEFIQKHYSNYKEFPEMFFQARLFALWKNLGLIYNLDKFTWINNISLDGKIYGLLFSFEDKNLVLIFNKIENFKKFLLSGNKSDLKKELEIYLTDIKQETILNKSKDLLENEFQKDLELKKMGLSIEKLLKY